MSITNTWNVVSMDSYPEKDGEQDVVFTVHWTLTATDGTYNGSIYGSVGVPLNTTGEFTPYAELTLDEVVGWVKEALCAEQVAEYEANVAAQIESQVNPTVIVLPLPWVTTSTAE
jgi:hypothetical protein